MSPGQFCQLSLNTFWKRLFAGGPPANKNLFAGVQDHSGLHRREKAPENNFLFAGGPPVNKFLFAGGPPPNKFLFAGGPPANNLFQIFKLQQGVLIPRSICLSIYLSVCLSSKNDKKVGIPTNQKYEKNM